LRSSQQGNAQQPGNGGFNAQQAVPQGNSQNNVSSNINHKTEKFNVSTFDSSGGTEDISKTLGSNKDKPKQTNIEIPPR
jgi:hypothetical protein